MQPLPLHPVRVHGVGALMPSFFLPARGAARRRPLGIFGRGTIVQLQKQPQGDAGNDCCNSKAFGFFLSRNVAFFPHFSSTEKIFPVMSENPGTFCVESIQRPDGGILVSGSGTMFPFRRLCTEGLRRLPWSSLPADSPAAASLHERCGVRCAADTCRSSCSASSASPLKSCCRIPVTMA